MRSPLATVSRKVADLEAHLVRRGLRLISPEEGPELFVAELLHGRKGESEIILAGGAEALARPNQPAVITSRATPSGAGSLRMWDVCPNRVCRRDE